MKTSLFNLINKAAKLTDFAVDSVKNLDLGDFGKKMSELKTTVEAKTSKLMEQAKKLNEKHIIEIPFDNEESTFSFKVDGNTLDINVKSKDGLKEQGSRFTIPQNVDAMNVRQSYDEARKVMVFKFGMKPTVQ